jgi:hypothetical protein
VLNRVPNKSILEKPYELWTERKLQLGSLRVWGCTAEVKIYNPHIKNTEFQNG